MLNGVLKHRNCKCIGAYNFGEQFPRFCWAKMINFLQFMKEVIYEGSFLEFTPDQSVKINFVKD